MYLNTNHLEDKMEIQKQMFFYNNLIPLQSVNEHKYSQYGPHIVHYAALDISREEFGLNDKQFIFLAIHDNNYIEIVETKTAYDHIHRCFQAFWSNSDYAIVKKSLELILNKRDYQLSSRIDKKTGKLMVKLELIKDVYSNTLELSTYTEKDVQEILKEIRIREHSDDIE
jgi:hypothetical protein